MDDHVLGRSAAPCAGSRAGIVRRSDRACSAERDVHILIAVADAVQNRRTGRPTLRQKTPLLCDVYIERRFASPRLARCPEARRSRICWRRHLTNGPLQTSKPRFRGTITPHAQRYGQVRFFVKNTSRRYVSALKTLESHLLGATDPVVPATFAGLLALIAALACAKLASGATNIAIARVETPPRSRTGNGSPPSRAPSRGRRSSSSVCWHFWRCCRPWGVGEAKDT
jgi:hypothetical protein